MAYLRDFDSWSDDWSPPGGWPEDEIQDQFQGRPAEEIDCESESEIEDEFPGEPQALTQDARRTVEPLDAAKIEALLEEKRNDWVKRVVANFHKRFGYPSLKATPVWLWEHLWP